MVLRKEDLGKDDLNVLNEMAFQFSQIRPPAQVAVRGAVVSCAAGSHYRYLNLPVSHGTTIGDDPVILESDCEAGKNINNFGICALKTKSATSTEFFENASDITGTIKNGAVTYGIPCTAVVVSNGWQNVDINSKAWNMQTLMEEGKAMVDSAFYCGIGGIASIQESGQKLQSMARKKSDTLEDHDISKIEIQEGDPVQVRVTGNDIKIDIYIEFKSGTEERKKLIRKGIKQWEGTYKYIGGHKAKLTIEIHEKDNTWGKSQKSVSVNCMDESKCVKETDSDKVKRDPNNRSHVFRNKTHVNDGTWLYDYAEVYLFPIENSVKYGLFNIPQEDDDGKLIYEVRKLTDKEYINIATHEFGHVLGLPDGYGMGLNILTLTSLITSDDIMLTLHYIYKVSISALDILMILGAAKNRMQALWDQYTDTPTLNSLREKCKNKVEE